MRTKWTEEWNSAQPVERTAFILVAIASFLNVLLGVLNYPVIGHDAYVHLNWLDQFTWASSRGICYPRWLPDSFGGFGAPTFYFYPPLVYWFASGFHFIGIAAAASLYQFIQLAFSFLSVLTAFNLLKQIDGRRLIALTGALLYGFLTYHFCDVYVRDALTEHAALAFLPIVFLRFPNPLRGIAIYAFGWTGLFLTNLPISYIALISILVVLFARGSFKELPIQAVSLIIAIAASAFYLFPAFGLRGLIHQRHLFDLPMHTSQFGFALLDIFQGHPDWLRTLSIATIIAGVICFVAMLKNSDSESRAWKWLIAVAIFFQIPFLSAPLWHLVPGMPFVQFSWRWNGILLLAIAAILVKGHTKIVHCVIIGLALTTILSELTLSRNLFVRPPLPINSFRMDAPEYAPKWASSDPNEVIGITLRRMSDPPALLLGLTAVNDSISLTSRNPERSNFTVRLERPATARFHQFYWPYWKLYKDSTEIPMSPDPNGFATAELPAGEYSVLLKLERSQFENASSVTSIFGCSMLIILLCFTFYRWITNGRDVTSPPLETRKI
jgi:hypothetical protein